ncbi:MAG: CRP-like cAMP-binding protein/CheY-like chemotaxis protein [Parvicellaceae bacterium]|jgi:CRP-like cAMP-binding protein/CheY-like chemotaxis protein
MKKVLIIEDEEIIRETTAEMLRLANYEVETAVNGKDGVQKAKEIIPDLILCDIMMPELDGYGVIYMLSRDPATSGIPFIFLSAKSEKSDVRKGMTLGADDYLTKPFEEMDLLNAIEGRLKRSEILKHEFAYTRDGLNTFIDRVHEITSLQGLYTDREPRAYKKKQPIYHEGDDPRYLFFLNEGKVRTYKIHADGKEYTTSLVKKGEFFGHVPIMEARDYPDFAEAMEDCEICRIPRHDFEQLLQRDREVGNAFIKLLSHNFFEQEKKLLSLAYDTVRKRTANALLELKSKFGKNEDEFIIDISRHDLASMVGTASESVIRTLSHFKEEGLITTDKKSVIHVVDSTGLEKIW